MFRGPCLMRLMPGVVLLLALLDPYARADSLLPVRYSVRHWTTEHGLPQSSARALAQTPDGYLWIGTLAGLARFDGVRFTVFDKGNTPGLASDAINSLGVDATGTLWIGTADGLIEWRGGVVRGWTIADGLPTKQVYDVIPEAGVGIWLRCQEHICLLKDGTFSRYGETHGITNVVRVMHSHPGGGLLALTREGAIHLPSDGQPAEPMVPWPEPSDHLQAQADEQGRVWLCGAQGFYRFEQDRWTFVRDWDITDAPRGKHLFRDRTGAFWIGIANYGLWRWQAGGFARVPLPEGALGQGIAAMLQDTEGNFWIGASGKLLQLRPQPIRTFTTGDGMADDETWSLSVGPDDSIWAGTKGGLVRIHNDQVGTPFDREPGSGFGVPLVFADSWRNIWLAKHLRGVHCFTNGVFGEVPRAAIPSDFVGVFYEDRQRRLWLESNGQIIVRDPDGRFKQMFTNDVGSSVGAILEDRHGHFWFGTHGKGVIRWNAGQPSSAALSTLSRFSMADGLASDSAWVFYEDAEGAIWIGGDMGLTRFKDGRFFAFTTAHGLFENTVNHIDEDRCGHLWLSGLQGLHRIARADLKGVAEGSARQVRCLTLGPADGMVSAETNGERQPAGCKTSDGRLWFPTGQGVVVVDPQIISDNEAGPPVVIEKVKAGEGEVEVRSPKSEIRNFKFAPGHGRVLEFRYTANCLSVPEKVRFKYKLEPGNSGWHDAGAQRFAFFQDLRPGNYTFRVKACNHHGIWNEAGASFAFSLAPHFYETSPFYMLCAVVIVGLGGSITAYRLRWQRRLLTAQHEQALAEERARIARDLHDDLGTALTGVALELDVAGRQSADGVATRLGETARRVRTLAERMREVVWAVNPRCDTVSSLVSFLEQEAGLLLKHTAVRARFEFPEELPALPLDSDTRHQLALGVREAITNALRHAQAKEIAITLALSKTELVIGVVDNGCGFDAAAAPATAGRGLHNLRARLQRLGGQCTIASKPGAGTRIEFRVPVSDLRTVKRANK